MEQQNNVEAKIININGNSIRVGICPQPANEFTLLIRNTGDQIKNKIKDPYKFRLECRLGKGEDALFLDENEAKNCTITVPFGWLPNKASDNADKNKFFFTISTNKKTLLEKDGYLKVKFSNFTSQTKPGEAILTFSTDLLENYSRPLTLSKEESKASEPGIIYFNSDPEAGTQNFPGDSVTLKWHTHKLNKLRLYQTGSDYPRLDSKDFTQEESSTKIRLQSDNVQFRLEGYSENKKCEKFLDIKVLQSGWHGVRNTIGKKHPAYPEWGNGENYDLEPTLLLNANADKLYGIFRFTDRERALLFETQNPFGNWKLLPTSVPEKEDYIPEGFSTSPGVYHDDKIWLIGGSQIDPDQCSNGVWCLDLTTEEKEWKKCTPVESDTDWKNRMGHAVLVFKDKIWVMGGRDEAGNALNDVWTLDIDSDGNVKKLTCIQKNDPSKELLHRWTGRCLFSTAVFENSIWLYGGVPEPFSGQSYDDLWSAEYKSDKLGEWKSRSVSTIQKEINFKKPIASCMQACNKRLYLFGRFSTDVNSETDYFESRALYLSTSPYYSWNSFDDKGLQDWGGNSTFSCQLVAYGDRMLIAKTLSYEAINTVMKIYVPPLK